MNFKNLIQLINIHKTLVKIRLSTRFLFIYLNVYLSHFYKILSLLVIIYNIISLEFTHISRAKVLYIQYLDQIINSIIG